MAINIDTGATKTAPKKAPPKATAGKQVDPKLAIIDEVGQQNIDRLFELEAQMQKMKALSDEYAKIRTEIEKSCNKHLSPDIKTHLQFDQGMIQIPACTQKTDLVDLELAKKRLAAINPKLLEECFTPSITKISGYLSGPQAEGVFDKSYTTSRKPKVKLGK